MKDKGKHDVTKSIIAVCGVFVSAVYVLIGAYFYNKQNEISIFLSGTMLTLGSSFAACCCYFNLVLPRLSLSWVFGFHLIAFLSFCLSFDAFLHASDMYDVYLRPKSTASKFALMFTLLISWRLSLALRNGPDFGIAMLSLLFPWLALALLSVLESAAWGIT